MSMEIQDKSSNQRTVLKVFSRIFKLFSDFDFSLGLNLVQSRLPSNIANLFPQ